MNPQRAPRSVSVTITGWLVGLASFLGLLFTALGMVDAGAPRLVVLGLALVVAVLVAILLTDRVRPAARPAVAGVIVLLALAVTVYVAVQPSGQVVEATSSGGGDPLGGAGSPSGLAQPSTGDPTDPTSIDGSDAESSLVNDPLTVTVPSPSGCPAFAVQDVGSLPARDEMDAEWVWSHEGGFVYGPAVLYVEGPQDRAVIITSIEVVDMKRMPVADGAALVLMCDPDGGALGGRSFGIDFSNNDTTAELLPQPNEMGENLTDFPYTVSSTDPELFQVNINEAPLCICSYRLKLNWLSDGKSGSTIIDSGDGREFRFVSTQDLPTYVWLEGHDLEKMW